MLKVVRVVIRVAAWSCVMAMAVVSLLPREALVRTDFGGHAEHVFAYAVTSLIVASAYRSLRPVLVFVALAAYGACLEYLQRFSPGRNSSLSDFAFSTAGVGVGVVLFVLLGKLPMELSKRRR